ncbi:MAG: PA14 domain-containing protein [Saprospiraceae bacterium]
MQPLPAVKTGKTESGLQFSYYEGSWKNLPDFKKLTPVKTGVANKVNLEKIGHGDNQFAVVLEGFVDLPKTGTYQFFTRSDDGSKLYIDGELVVDNDGDHGAFWEYGTTILEKGNTACGLNILMLRATSTSVQASWMKRVLGRSLRKGC